MKLIDFEAQITRFSNFNNNGNTIRVFELKSLDPNFKIRTVSLPVEEATAAQINVGRVLRITVEAE